MIGHRISIRQTRALRARIAAGHGTAIELGGGHFHAFPTPGQLLAAASLEGINPAKTERLRAIARAAQEGRLDRDQLRAARGRRARAAAVPTRDRRGFSRRESSTAAPAASPRSPTRSPDSQSPRAYALKAPAGQDTVRAIAERWRPTGCGRWCSCMPGPAANPGCHHDAIDDTRPGDHPTCNSP